VSGSPYRTTIIKAMLLVRRLTVMMMPSQTTALDKEQELFLGQCLLD